MPGKKGSKHGTASMSLEKRIEVSRAGGLAAYKKRKGVHDDGYKTKSSNR